MMRKTKKFLSLVSLLLLMAVIACSMISCGTEEVKNAVNDVVSDIESALDDVTKVTVTIEITDDKGETTSKEYATSATTLREVLEENNLVEGEESEYGLMITTVNGLKADYNTDKSYWALYKDGEYMMTGADDEILTDGATYGLVYTKD